MKQSLSKTQKEYVKRILKVLVYIEQHLDDELTIETLAQLAHFSVFHFHRLFRVFVGEPLNGYIRRLRLERAAGQLKSSQLDVTTIAMDAGFATHAAFSQAFRKRWGDTPTRYRISSMEQELQLRLSLKQKDYKMEVKLVQRNEEKVLFIRRLGNYNQSAPEAFMALDRFIQAKGLDPAKMKFYGIAHDNPDVVNDEEKCRFDSCIVVPPGIEPEGEIATQKLPAGLYARFTHVGSCNNLPITYDYIYGVWYPQSGRMLADRPCLIEFIDAKGDKPEEERICYVHLPLKE